MIHPLSEWRLGDPGHDGGQRREFAVSGCGELHADQQLRSQVAWPIHDIHDTPDISQVTQVEY